VCALATALVAPSSAGERYRYIAVPSRGDAVEVHDVRIDTTATGLAYRFGVTRGAESERGVVVTTTGGGFVSGWRTVTDADGGAATDSLWVEGGTLRLVRRHDGETEVKAIDLPADKTLAVDASALLWLRGFPFGSGEKRELFMVDWSGRTVDVDVHDRGLETIEVPAGTFACRRVEFVIRVLFFRPRITFWVAADPPRFLVRHRGKRGPFTPVFVTTLDRIAAD